LSPKMRMDHLREETTKGGISYGREKTVTRRLQIEYINLKVLYYLHKLI